MVLVWGFNFVVIRWGLETAPPLLLTFLRFLIASVPAVFFIKPPRAPWPLVFAYGVFAFGMQFSLLFAGMNVGFTAGLSSLVIQVQVFITIGLVALTLHERPRAHQLVGAGVAAAGLALVAFNLPRGGTLLGFFLVLLAAGAWSVANLLIKRIGHVDPLALVVWGSLASCPLLLVASLALEGPRRIAQALAAMGPLDWLGVVFQAGPTTPARLRRLGLVDAQASGRGGHAVRAAGSRGRDGERGAVPGRTAAVVEARRRRAGARRPGAQRLRRPLRCAHRADRTAGCLNSAAAAARARTPAWAMPSCRLRRLPGSRGARRPVRPSP